MLDVLERVDSPAKSPKCVDTLNEQEPKAPAQNYRNQTIRFQNQDTLVLSRLETVRGAVGLRQCASPPAKRRLDDGEA
jgi:hypothetical protein